jgi:subtilisin family serine protease
MNCMVRAISLAMPAMVGAVFAVHAQQPARATLTLQAIGPHISPDLVRLVARAAEPTVLRHYSFSRLEETTPETIIRKLCGSIRQEYLAEAAHENGLGQMPLREPLGERVREFRWPACLYVKVASDSQVTVEPGDTAFGIYQAHTGGGGSKRAVERFFRKDLSKLHGLKPGTSLSISSFSKEVTLVARADAAFELLDEIKRLDSNGTMVKEVNGPEGEIVVGVADGTIASGPACQGGSVPPIAATRIVKAYLHTKKRAAAPELSLRGGPVEVAVVDNGFFGARLGVDGADPFEGSAFRRDFFKFDPDSVIAASVQLGADIRPINYSNAIAPGTISSHGTHVAGLVFGGPYFADQWDAISKDRPWVSMMVLNVGNGGRRLIKGAPTVLANALAVDNTPRIVNLSIAHDGHSDARVRKNYQDLFATARHSLFVAAAGNYGRDVGEQFVYPAALGGQGGHNVLTVAAIDGFDRLPSFTNDGPRVDLVAPGCQILSWTEIGAAPVPMNGTSQAAPLATFAATLIRSLANVAAPSTLKTRLIVSGDLLPAAQRHRTAYGVKLNVDRALLFLDDYARISGPQGGEFLGSLRPGAPIRCTVGTGTVITRNFRDMWALKRDGSEALYFAGKGGALPDAPCTVVPSDQETVGFWVTHHIVNGDIQRLPSPREFTWRIADIQDLVVAIPPAELR